MSEKGIRTLCSWLNAICHSRSSFNNFSFATCVCLVFFLICTTIDRHKKNRMELHLLFSGIHLLSFWIHWNRCSYTIQCNCYRNRNYNSHMQQYEQYKQYKKCFDNTHVYIAQTLWASEANLTEWNNSIVTFTKRWSK